MYMHTQLYNTSQRSTTVYWPFVRDNPREQASELAETLNQ